MISVWQITKKKHTKSAFTGEGARLYGGRWNSPGKPVVYTAESRALALVEILVHLNSAGLLAKYVVFQVEIDKPFIAHLEPPELPSNWQMEPAPKQLQMLGDAWLESQRSPILRVPSAIVGGEFNYLLNPLHVDFSKLRIHRPEKIAIDKRLLK